MAHVGALLDSVDSAVELVEQLTADSLSLVRLGTLVLTGRVEKDSGRAAHPRPLKGHEKQEAWRWRSSRLSVRRAAMMTTRWQHRRGPGASRKLTEETDDLPDEIDDVLERTPRPSSAHMSSADTWAAARSPVH